jgi:hypothetical protein
MMQKVDQEIMDSSWYTELGPMAGVGIVIGGILVKLFTVKSTNKKVEIEGADSVFTRTLKLVDKLQDQCNRNDASETKRQEREIALENRRQERETGLLEIISQLRRMVAELEFKLNGCEKEKSELHNAIVTTAKETAK